MVHFATMILPAILILLETEFNISLVQLGSLVTIQIMCMGLGGLPAGIMVDRFGSRKILIVYFTGLVLVGFWLYISKSYLGMVLGMGVLGLITGLYHPAGLKIVSHAQNISKYMAYHGVFGSLGLAAGPLFGGWIGVVINWRSSYLLVSVLGIIGLLLATQYPEKKVVRNWPSFKINLTSAHGLIFMVAALWGVAHHGLFNFLPYYFSERVSFGSDAVAISGSLTGLVLLIGIVGQLTGGKIGAKYSRRNLQMWVVALNIPFLLLMSVMDGAPLIIIVCMLGIVNFMFQPINNILIADISPSEGRGLIYGISFGLSFGIGSLAGIIGGYIGDILQTNMIFPAMAVFLIPATFFARLLKKDIKNA